MPPHPDHAAAVRAAADRLLFETDKPYQLASTADVQLVAAAAQRALEWYENALMPLVLTDHDDLILPQCVLCSAIGYHRYEIKHDPSCVLAPAPTAGAGEGTGE